MIPSFVTGINSISKPFSCKAVHEEIMELCSSELTKICLPLFLYLKAVPRMAKLLDSVAQLV